MTVRERVDDPVVNRLMTCAISPRKVSEPDQRLNIINKLRIRSRRRKAHGYHHTSRHCTSCSTRWRRRLVRPRTLVLNVRAIRGRSSCCLSKSIVSWRQVRGAGANAVVKGKGLPFPTIPSQSRGVFLEGSCLQDAGSRQRVFCDIQSAAGTSPAWRSWP
jgi:hypothetical protein